MIKVRCNEIIMTRGDTLVLRVVPTRDGEPYVPLPGDSIRFALKHDKMDIKRTAFLDTEPLVMVDIPTDTMLLRLEPEHTKGLEFGNYVYDCELTTAEGFVSTFIADSPFILRREVH